MRYISDRDDRDDIDKILYRIDMKGDKICNETDEIEITYNETKMK